MKTALALAVLVAASADPVSLLDQQDGINSHRRTTVAVYCHKAACKGKLKLELDGATIGSAPFSIDPKTTEKIPVTLTHSGFAAVKAKPKHKAKVTLAVTMASGQVLTHLITLYV